MEIRHILLKNFKRFSQYEISFSQGLNVVKGPNEAGKSTLHEAIILALLDRPTGKQSERRHQSWGKERLYEVKLTYQLPSGEEFKIHKDFEARTHEVLGPEGKDNSRSGLTRAIQMALGTTSEKLFSSTACIRQDSMMELDKGGKEISAQLQEIAMGGVSGVNEAIDRLEDKVLEFERGWKTNAPRNPGPIGQLIKQLSEVEELIRRVGPEVDKREKAQEELFQQKERSAAIERECEPLNKLRTSYAVRQDLMEALDKHSQLERDLEQKTERVEGVEKRKEQVVKKLESLKRFNGFDKQRNREFQKARDNWKARLAEVKDREARVLELEKRLEDGKKASILKQLYWAVGTILLGLTLGSFSALSDGVSDIAYRTALLIAGGTLTVAGGLWLLVLVVHRIRNSNNLQHLLAEAQARYQRGRTALTSAKSELKVLLESFGCETWEALESNLTEFKKLHIELEMVEATLSVLLGTESSHAFEDKRRETSRARRDIQEQLKVLEEVPELSAVEYQKLSSEIELLVKEKQERQEQIIRLEALAESGGSTLEDLHRSMERRAALQHRLDLALERHQVFQMTLEGLREVRDQILKNAQRELEPRLGAYLERLTQGRYTQAHVDENLQVQISLNSKNNHFVSVDDLSSGTRDQVYLAARLALCDMIFQDARPPLLMDDPFIKFDPERKEAALLLCKELSAERQIILFTCHAGYDPYADHVIALE